MSATLFTTDAQPREREPARVPLDLAWESAWWARTYHGVLVTESADGWQATNVLSVCEVAVDAPALAVVSERKQKQRRAA